jgi:Spy/CpxP family protein refolding chaperone
MRTTTIIIGIAAFALAGLSAEAMAQGRGLRGGGPGGRFAALGLSPQQKQQIDQYREAAWKQAEPLHAQMQAKFKEMQQLWRADQPDRAAIIRKHGELDAIRDQQRNIWIDFRLQVHAVLTSEQRIKWADHMGGGPGPGGGFGRGRGHGFMRGGPGFGGGFGPGPGPGGFGGPNCPMQAQ